MRPPNALLDVRPALGLRAEDFLFGEGRGRGPLVFLATFGVLDRRPRSRFFVLPFATSNLGLPTLAAFLTERVAGFFRVFLAVVLVKADIRGVRVHE